MMDKLGHTISTLRTLVLSDSHTAYRDPINARAFRLRWTPMFENTYRVLVNLQTGRVEVVCLGIDKVDSDTEGVYKDSSELPMWMQEKLAVLSIMEVSPPQVEVPGVGIRIDQNTYWILK